MPAFRPLACPPQLHLSFVVLTKEDAKAGDERPDAAKPEGPLPMMAIFRVDGSKVTLGCLLMRLDVRQA